MARGVKRRVTIVLSIALGVFLFAAVVNNVGGVGAITAEIGRLGPWGGALAFANVGLMVFGWMWSWKLLLNAYGLHPSWGLLGRAVLGGYALSYLTPSMYFGGEPFRIYLVSRELQAQSAQVTATVVIWKILEGGTLFSLVIVGSFNAVLSGAMDLGEEISLGVGNVLVIGGWGLLAWSFITKRHWSSRLCGVLARRVPWGRERVARICAWLDEAETVVAHAFAHHTKAVLAALAITLVVNLTVFVRPFIFFWFSGGLLLGFRNLSFIFAMYFFLSSFLWVTPGGLGISEGGLVGIFELIGRGIPARAVTAYAISVRLMELAFIVVGVGILIHFGAVKLPKLRRGKTGSES